MHIEINVFEKPIERVLRRISNGSSQTARLTKSA
jgi:hypothetical protein